MSSTTNHTNNTNVNADIIQQKSTVLIQQYAASCVAICNMMIKYSNLAIEKINSKENPNKNHLAHYERLVQSSNKLMNRLNDPEYNYSKSMKKIYDIVKTPERCSMLVDKDPNIFKIKNNGFIVCFLKNMNIDLVYKRLSDEDRVLLWNYFYLVIQSTLLIFRLNNPKSINAKVHVTDAMNHIENELSENGIKFNDIIFNPFLGIGEADEKYDISKMYSNMDALPSGNDVGSMKFMLQAANLDKIVDLKAYKEQLDKMTAEDIKFADEKIRDLLKIPENSEAGIACNTLLTNLITELQTSGIDNIPEALTNTAKKSKGSISMEAMAEAGVYAQEFIKNGQQNLDKILENNPEINSNMVNSIKGSLGMLNMIPGFINQDDPDNTDNQGGESNTNNGNDVEDLD